MIRDLFSIGDALTLAGIVLPVFGGTIYYFRKRLDIITDNHLAHLDEKIDGVADKVDHLSSDVQQLTGRLEGWDFDRRITRLERAARDEMR